MRKVCVIVAFVTLYREETISLDFVGGGKRGRGSGKGSGKGSGRIKRQGKLLGDFIPVLLLPFLLSPHQTKLDNATGLPSSVSDI